MKHIDMYVIGLIGVVEIVELHLLLLGLFGSYVAILPWRKLLGFSGSIRRR